MTEKRFYVDVGMVEDEDDDLWYVWDSQQEPHKAISSWSSEQDAKDDADIRNNSLPHIPMTLASTENKITGIELLRYAVRLFNNGNETFALTFDEDKLLKIAQGYRACDWDVHPDRWEERQISDLLVYDKIPQWDENEQPIYK